jgi:UDP-N-acetylmuramoylalanine--D-glutamate ligase
LDHHHAVVLGGPVNFEAALMSTLKDTSVLILGLGVSGLAMARWCANLGARVTVVDNRAAPPQLAVMTAQLPDVKFVHSEFVASLVEGTDIRAVFKSPGLSPGQTELVLNTARASGLWVGGELSLFVQGLQSLKEAQDYAPDVLAITGTNGKTTVTSLAGQLVERAGKTVTVAGNIGPSLLDTLSAHILAQTLPQVWVLELSSFQLDDVVNFTPKMGTVLNLSQDHLDWHGDMQAYGAAKMRIFGPHSVDAAPMLLNRDDPAVMAMVPALIKGKPQRNYMTFGVDIPTRPGDWGLETVNGMTWLVKAMEADETRRRRKDDAEEVHVQRLMPADALRIRGLHNATNALAALALASAAGCSLAPMLYGLREYRGEPHRVESVGIVQDVEYFDDSKGTNVGATVAALAGLGVDRKLVLILGGEGKGQDFSALAQPVARYARAVVLIGRDAETIARALDGAGVDCIRAQDMEHAVKLAAERAHAGDAVLMSPACASFDMFENYEHRARVFCAAVSSLAQAAGSQLGEVA